jgi:hypothetical protein
MNVNTKLIGFALWVGLAASPISHAQVQPAFTNRVVPRGYAVPGYTNVAPAYTNVAPRYTNVAPAYTNVAPRYTVVAPGYTNVAPGFTNFAPGFSNRPPGFTNFPPAITNRFRTNTVGFANPFRRNRIDL